MSLFVVRESSCDVGVAYGSLPEAMTAARGMPYAEIVRTTLRKRGAALHCALFNRELGEDARIVAVVHGGNVLMLNYKLAPQQVYACPRGCVRGVLAPVGARLVCGVCSAPLQSG